MIGAMPDDVLPVGVYHELVTERLQSLLADPEIASPRSLLNCEVRTRPIGTEGTSPALSLASSAR